MNIAAILSERARELGDAPALIDVKGGQERVVSFRELDAITARVAAEIAERGIGRGDGVLILHPMAIELYVFLIALFRIGAVGMFLDPSAGRTYIDHCMKIYSPRGFLGSWKAQLLRLWTPSLRGVSPAFCTSRFPGTRLISLDGKANGGQAIAEVDDEAPALITFTSGSTGQPKAALRTHGFLVAQHRALEKSLELRPGVCDLTTLPIFVLANLASGVTSVLPDADMRAPGKIAAGPVLKQIERHAIATTAASPAFVARLADECGRAGRRVPELKHVFMGGAPVFPGDLRQARALFRNAEITAVYGSTEAEPMAEIHLSEIAEEDFREMEGGAGLLTGVPVSAIELRIVREQWGRPMGHLTGVEFDALCLVANEVGEIAVSGKHVLPGYLHGVGDAETKFDVDGARWHRTGDLGWMDGRGRLWLMGRASAAICDGKGVLYPFAAECAAMQVEGVRRAAILQVAGRRVMAVEGAVRAAETGRDLGEIDGKRTAGPKGHVHSIALMPGLKPRPTAKARFSATFVTEELVLKMKWAHLDEIRVLDSIPMDKRHNAKVDYGALAAALARPGGKGSWR